MGRTPYPLSSGFASAKAGPLRAAGDRDFQDVVIGIHATGDGFLFT
jgi:hypothetical protein